MKHYQGFIWFSLLFIFFANASGLSNCQPGLDCWIHSLSINIPNTTFTQTYGTLYLNQITCNNISVPSITSSIPSPLNVEVSSKTLGMNCVANWYLSAHNETGSGTLGVVVSGSDFTLLVSLIANASYGLIGSVEATCSMLVPNIFLAFSNSSYITTLNKFEPAIQSYLGSQISHTSCSAVMNATETNVANAYSSTNSWAWDTMANNETGPLSPMPPTDGLIDLKGNPVMGLIDYVLNDLVGASGTLGFNTIFNVLTNGTGSFSFNYANSSIIQRFTPLQSQSFAIGDIGTMTITPQRINISGLTDWELVDFLEPVSSQTLDSRTIANNLQLAIEFSLNISFTSGPMNGGSIFELVVLKTNLLNSSFFLETYVGLSSQQFEILNPSQLAFPACLASTLVNMNINYLDIDFLMDQIEVTTMNEVGTQLDQLLDNALATFVQSYSPAIPQIINGFLWPPYGLGIPFLNIVLPSLVNKTFYGKCPGPKHDDPTFNEWATVFACVGAVGAFGLMIFAASLVVQFSGGSRKETTPLLAMEIHKGNALMFNPSIPFVIRYGVLLVLLLNIAMFIASNASLGASVYLLVRTTGGVTEFPSLFNFSLVNSVRDMWNAKVYALSILIALFSGVWPYTKLVLLILSWCLPASVLALKRRGRILIMLDAMGKWSLIDSFVLILMMVAFHFTLAPPITTHTPEGLISFEAYVEPHFGFYSFLVATMLSLVITHLVIKVHKFSVETDESDYIGDSKEALWAHAAVGRSPHKAAYLLVLVTLLLITSSVLLGFGITSPSFDFTFQGAFGAMLRFLDQPYQLTFSVVSLGFAFPASSVDPDSVGTRFIQVSFFIFAVAMPIAYLGCLLVLWMVPLTYKVQSRLLTLTSTIHAWSALEVFVVSIIAALLELQQFAQFIVGNRCDEINKLLVIYGDEILHGDDKCFDVVATLKSGCWVLFAACVIYVVVGSLVVKACHNALKGRLERPGVVN